MTTLLASTSPFGSFITGGRGEVRSGLAKRSNGPYRGAFGGSLHPLEPQSVRRDDPNRPPPGSCSRGRIALSA